MSKYMVIGAGVAGLAVAYMIYRTAGKAGQVVKDAANAINPLNDHNVISEASDSLYRALGGATNPGADLYDVTHNNGVVDQGLDLIIPWSGRSVGSYAGAATYDGVQAVKGASESVGAALYDWFH